MLANIRYCGWLLLLALGLHAPAFAAPLKVALLGAPDAVQALRQGWQGEAPQWVDAPDADVLITLGEAAFAAADKWQKPRLALDVPDAVVRRARGQHCMCSSVALHPAPIWQLKLVRLLFQGHQRVALVHAAADSELAATLARKAPAGLTLTTYAVKDGADLSLRLAGILDDNDILLLLPSNQLFNADSARFILLSSYRLGRPVIGPDAAFVKAGSLASVDASNAAIFAAIHQQLRNFSEHGRLLAPLFPAPEVAVNDHVAHSFDLDVATPANLLQRLGAEHAATR